MIRQKYIFATALLIVMGAVSACSVGNETHTSSSPAAEMSPMQRGAILYKRCRACHTLGQGERHKVGPNLWNVYGSEAGSREDFNYSQAMAASDIVWDDATLSAYLEKPSEFLPGNRMSFAGLRKPEDRAAILEYLRAETGG